MMLSLLLLGCGAAQERSPGVNIESVDYTADWDWNGVEREPGEVGFSVETNLGYRVRVDAGELVNHTLQLVPCEEDQTEAGDGLAWMLPWRSRPAIASDGGVVDPSALPDHFVEEFASLQALALGSVEFDRAFYCSLHYLVAPIALGGSSLLLSGEVTDSGGNTTNLEVQTATAWGVVLPLAEAESSHHLDLQLKREIGTLFDDIDFSEPGDLASLSQAVLRNLVQGAALSSSGVED